ncbi:tubulin gamma [Nematocida sp. AWRm77]|nr:tubulin gamma [Nematocida sp. AWRm77]
MGHIITLQVGQCGNQVGAEFWDRLCYEHGLSDSGKTARPVEHDRKDVFFYESYDGRFFPRSILMDLEPRVVSAITSSKPHLFSPENVFIGHEGGGAGNVWARGYQKGKEYKEALLETVQREAEGSDILSGFVVFHSVGGGTGSGLGSFMLEELRDKMPKKAIQSVSIFPNNEASSDSVVQPYNTVLSVRRLKECTDGVLAMDNGALYRTVGDSLKVSQPTLGHINQLASIVAAAATSTLRFPGSRFSDLSSLLCLASPVPGCHFLVPSYSPFLEAGASVLRKTTCLDVQRRLLLPKSRLMVFEESESNCVVSAINLMMGVESSEVEKSLLRLRQRSTLRFAPWAPPSIQVGIGLSPESNISGLLLTNTTGISRALHRITTQYDSLKKRNAFVDMYRKEGEEYLEEFDAARETVQWLIDEYKRAELTGYASY